MSSSSKTYESGLVASFDGTPIYYQHRGNTVTGLVLVHGWLGNSGYWDAQIDLLAKDFTVISVDLAGHGRSGGERHRYGIEAFGKDILEVIQRFDLEQLVLVGHSMGGPVVLEAARTRQVPVVGVICVDSPLHHYYRSMDETEIEQLLAPFRVGFPAAVKKFAKQMFHATTDRRLVGRIARQMASTRPDIGLNTLEALFRYDVMRVLNELKVPVRSLATTADPESFPLYKSTIEIIPMENLGHFPMLEAPTIFNRQLLKEIRAILGDSR
jgi:sigma-B regulation protein RsbQ